MGWCVYYCGTVQLFAQSVMTAKSAKSRHKLANFTKEVLSTKTKNLSRDQTKWNSHWTGIFCLENVSSHRLQEDNKDWDERKNK